MSIVNITTVGVWQKIASAGQSVRVTLVNTGTPVDLVESSGTPAAGVQAETINSISRSYSGTPANDLWARAPIQPAAVNVVANGSGSSGGAVTIADGANVTQGTTTDAAYTGSGAGTLVALLKGIYSKVSSVALAAGTRTADMAQLTTAAAALLQSAAASVVVRGQLLVSSAGANAILGGVSPTQLIYDQSTSQVGAWNGTNDVKSTLGAGTTTSGFGVAFGFNAAGRALAGNRGTVVTDANGIGNVTSVYLGRDSAGHNDTGRYHELVIWPTRLSNAALQAQARPWQ